MRLIGISGKINSGKDTAAEVIQRLHPEYEIKKYAEKLKIITSLMTGIDRPLLEDREVKDKLLPDYSMTVREFMQKLGTDAVRDGLHTNAWVNALFADLNEDSRWLVTDVRFENEVTAIKERGGHIIRIERPGLETGTHPSETALDGRNDLFDAIIHNNRSLESFKRTVLSVFHTLPV